MLANPVAGFVWLIIQAAGIIRSKNVKLWLLSFMVFFAICSPWFVRNYLVFDKVIFIKSNLFHDWYFFNYETQDGHPSEALAKRTLVWTTKKNPDSEYRNSGTAALWSPPLFYEVPNRSH